MFLQCIIAADNFDSMFIWSGKATLQSANFDSLRIQCKLFLQERARSRFPSPTIFELKEGESMARRFSSRLIPSHGDTEDDQRKNFTALDSLTDAELQRLRTKFRFYDPRSDSSFVHWFAMVSNQSLKASREGRSLCE